MSMRSAQALFPACLLALVCALALPAHADTVLYSTGFENPPFTVGSISGQDGWNVAGPGRTDVVNTLTCVGTCIADTGSQAVYVDGITAEGIWHQDSSIGTPYVDLSADIAIVLGNTQGEWVFAATGNGLGPFLGGIEIDESGEIRGITTDPVPLGTFAKTTSLDSPTWNHVDLLFDIATQTYSISINGDLLASNLAFCEARNAPCTNGTTTFGDGIFETAGFTGAGAHPDDSGFIDNYTVSNVSSAVPEASSVLLLVTVLVLVTALGGAAALRRNYPV